MKPAILTRDTVLLGADVVDKANAIRQVGELLITAGCIAPLYIDGMLAREASMSTYLDNGIAIPHGQLEDLDMVYRTGVAVLQVPEGVEWEPGEKAYLIIGLAAKPAALEQKDVLMNLVEILSDRTTIRLLIHTTDPMVIIERLTRTRSET